MSDAKGVRLYDRHFGVGGLVGCVHLSGLISSKGLVFVLLVNLATIFVHG